MNTDTSALVADLNYVLGDSTFAATLEYGSVSVAGTAGAERRTKDVFDGGEVYLFERTWGGKVASFSALPDVKQAVSIAGTAYWIEERVVDPDGLFVTFILRRTQKL